MSAQITIHKSKKKSFFIIVAGLLMLLASYLSFTYANDEVFGWIFIIAAALILILGMSNFRDRKAQIVLTERGITEIFSIREEIEWNAIVGVDDFFFRGHDFVRILLPESYKPDLILPTWFWRFNRLYAQQGLKAIYIRVSGLEINSRQLTTIIVNMVNTDPSQRSNYLNSVKGKF